MTTKEIIYKLLYQALIEIREEAYISKSPKIFQLADIFHNVPLILEKAHEADDFKELMMMIKDKAAKKAVADWIENHLSDFTQNI